MVLADRRIPQIYQETEPNFFSGKACLRANTGSLAKEAVVHGFFSRSSHLALDASISEFC